MLVDRQRHQLPFVVASDERVVRLMRDVPRQAAFLRDRERLHQMPGGKIRAPDVADLPGSDEVVKRAKRFLDRRFRVEAVELIEVDVVSTEPAQAPLDCAEKMLARRSHVVRARARSEGALRGDENAIPPSLDRAAKDLLGLTRRVNIRRVEQRHASIETEVDEPSGMTDVESAEGPEKFAVAATESGRAEGKRRDHQPRTAKLSMFHQ
jgi:hypothetical protein